MSIPADPTSDEYWDALGRICQASRSKNNGRLLRSTASLRRASRLTKRG
jgi:hypothetical protein